MPERLSHIVEFDGSALHIFLRKMKQHKLSVANRPAKESRKYILKLCCQMHIPPHLRAIDLAMENILNAIDSLKVECEDLSLIESVFEERLEGLEEFASFMLSQSALLGESGAVLLGDSSEIVEGQHPMAKQWGNYSIYSMLMNSPEFEAYEAGFYALQIIVLTAYTSLSSALSLLPVYVKDQAKRIKHHNSSASSAGYFIRHLSGNRVDEEELELIEGSVDIYSWCLEIISTRNDSVTEERPEYRVTLSPLISKWISMHPLLQNREGYKKRAKAKPYNRKSVGWYGGYCRYHSNIVSETVLIDDNDTGNSSGRNGPVIYGGGSSVSIKTIKVRKAKLSIPQEELKYADLEEDEQSDYEENICVEDNSPSCNNIVSKRQISKIIQANQNLIFQFSTATSVEIQQFVSLCREIIDDPLSHHHDEMIFYMAPIALLMLYSGCSLKDVVVGTRWSKSKAQTRAKLTSVTVEGERFWLLKVPTVQRRRKQSEGALQACRPVESYIKLSDEFNLASVFERQHQDRIAKKEITKLFTKRLPDYRKMLNSLLTLLPDGNRLNEHKIANFLPSYIIHKTNDVAVAILTTGQYIPLGKTLLHYSAPSPQYLERLRNSVWSDICSTLMLPSNVMPHGGKPIYQYDSSVSSLSPSLDGVSNMVKQTRRELANALKVRDIQKAHNFMTYYMSQMFAYATGVRAICSPLACITSFDPKTGVVVISDKDGEDFYNSRLCILPSLVVRQLDTYHQHVISLKQSTFFASLNNHQYHLFPSFFYLNNECGSNEIKPSTSFALQESFFPLPLNTNRRFLRTYLMEKDVNGEAINAFMGHWGLGQEPWGRFSSCSPIDLIEIVAPHINELLKVLGFGLEKGLSDV